MASPIDSLDAIVSQATERLAFLRAEIARLEAALGERRAPSPERGGSMLAEENRRLLEERRIIQDRIRGLIREIDGAL